MKLRLQISRISKEQLIVFYFLIPNNTNWLGLSAFESASSLQVGMGENLFKVEKIFKNLNSLQNQSVRMKKNLKSFFFSLEGDSLDFQNLFFT